MRVCPEQGRWQTRIWGADSRRFASHRREFGGTDRQSESWSELSRWSETMDRPGIQRRGFLVGAAAAGAVGANVARAQNQPSSIQTDNAPKELAGKPMPEPSPAQSSGPIVPGRGSNLAGKVAVVT